MPAKGIWTIGNVIKMIREEQGISLEQLSYGLCSVSTLSRIENEEREMNILFFMILFGRLGYYPDKYEFYGSKEEYEQYEQRALIQTYQKGEKYKQMILELEQYKEEWAEDILKDSLQQQFVDSMEGFLLVHEKKYDEGIKLLKRAVEKTIPNWDELWYEKLIIGEQELNIMNILADGFEMSGEEEHAYQLRKHIYIYLEQRKIERLQVLQLYTTIICKMVPWVIKCSNLGQALVLCNDGIQAIAKRGRLYHLGELLYWKAQCLEELYHVGKEPKEDYLDIYWRAYYIFRLEQNEEMSEKIKLILDKEEPEWESIRLEKLLKEPEKV